MGTLFHSFSEYYFPQLRAKAPADPEKFKKVQDAFGFLESFLEGQTYVAGDHLTIADLAILASVSTFEVAKFDISKYKNVAKWYNHCKKVAPGWDINAAGLKEFISTQDQLPNLK